MCSPYVRVFRLSFLSWMILRSALFVDLVQRSFVGSLILCISPLPESFLSVSPMTLWLFPQPRICTALAFLSKFKNILFNLGASFYSHPVIHEGHIPIFMDGSKSVKDVGSVAVFSDRTLSHTLFLGASIFTAELWCVVFALSPVLILDSDASYIVYSNSRNIWRSSELIS